MNSFAQPPTSAKIQNMGILETSDHSLIKIKIPDSSQEPSASSKGPNHDLKDMGVLQNFIIHVKILVGG